MSVSWVVIRDSVCCRKTGSDQQSKNLVLGPHFAVRKSCRTWSKSLTSLGLKFLICAMGRAVPTGREVVRLR